MLCSAFCVCVCVLFFVGESTSKFCGGFFVFFCTPKKFEQNRLSRTTLLVIHCVHEQYSLLDTVHVALVSVESHSMLLVGVVNCVHAIFSSTSETHKYKTKHAPQYLSTPCSAGSLSGVLSKNWDLPTRRNDTYKLAFMHTHS